MLSSWKDKALCLPNGKPRTICLPDEIYDAVMKELGGNPSDTAALRVVAGDWLEMQTAFSLKKQVESGQINRAGKK